MDAIIFNDSILAEIQGYVTFCSKTFHLMSKNLVMPLLRKTIDVFQVQCTINILFDFIFAYFYLNSMMDIKMVLRSYTKYMTFRCHVFHNQDTCLIAEYIIYSVTSQQMFGNLFCCITHSADYCYMYLC